MKLKHWLVFILLGAIWSSSFMWIKIALQEVGQICWSPFVRCSGYYSAL